MEDEAGVRRLTEITRNENGVYALRQTPPLPTGVWMDSFHAGMEGLLLEWDQQHHQVNFRARLTAQWKLIWLTCYGENETLNCSFGLNTGTLMDTDTLRIGVLPFDLFADDLTTLPCTLRGADRPTGPDRAGGGMQPRSQRPPSPADKAQPGSGFAGQVLERHACAGAQ